jgi:hypothetical protein
MRVIRDAKRDFDNGLREKPPHFGMAFGCSISNETTPAGAATVAYLLCYAPANQCSAVPFRIIESLSILAGEAWGSSTARKMFAWAAK